ncbi:MAG: PD-(D/E)XK nuclease family transposase [Prevotella sp.]|nr:PD-(D/E)XK nuclease family transposase [Prevotella sp.]
MKERTFVSFDWALKRILRDKANFGVLEGFLTTLLKFNVKIHRLLESESNKERNEAKYNRVDLLAEDGQGELVLIEVQGEPEFAYFQRMLFGASKLVTDYINGGQNYENVKKIYSVNIVYFDLGQGDDVVYQGKTEFRGIHNGDLLRLSPYQRQKFNVSDVYQLYPEYYILKVNDFNKWSRVPLDQWLYFLCTSDIPEDADAPGLKEAREKLAIMKMTREEQRAYDSYRMSLHILENTMETARGEAMLEGHAKGLEEGRVKGLEEGRAKGMEEGRAKGLEEGRVKGMEEGRVKGMEEGRVKGLEEGRVKGLEEGRVKGLEEGRAKGMEEGRAKGMEEGRAKGMEEGRVKGLEEGRAQGLEKGAQDKAADIARKMKSKGMAVSEIAELTGLTVDEIIQLLS